MTSILIVTFIVSVGTGADITSFDKQLKYIRLIVESYMAGGQHKHSRVLTRDSMRGACCLVKPIDHL